MHQLSSIAAGTRARSRRKTRAHSVDARAASGPWPRPSPSISSSPSAGPARGVGVAAHLLALDRPGETRPPASAAGPARPERAVDDGAAAGRRSARRSCSASRSYGAEADAERPAVDVAVREQRRHVAACRARWSTATHRRRPAESSLRSARSSDDAVVGVLHEVGGQLGGDDRDLAGAPSSKPTRSASSRRAGGAPAAGAAARSTRTRRRPRSRRAAVPVERAHRVHLITRDQGACARGGVAARTRRRADARRTGPSPRPVPLV